jgi:CubicO group peptidase (beta-lactamase class C family)
MKIFKKLMTAVVACMSLATFATEMPYASNVTSGFRKSARIAYVNPPSDGKQVKLSTAVPPSQAKKVLDELFQKNNAKALLVSQDSDIIYERYASGVGKRDSPLGFSVSKSLVSLTVGRAICDGHIKSIDDELKRYVPALSGTSWGESSIRNVLMMSSGAYKTPVQFDGHKSAEMQRSLGAALYDGKMSDDFIDIMRSADEKISPSGKDFNYSNFDTVALGLLIQGATKTDFANYFEKTIWADVGAESRGAWVINNKSQASAYAGFSANPQDWLRIGNMVLRELKNQDTCFGKYLKEATSKKIDTFRPGPAPSYGYQIWVQCRSSDFCFVGFGGQYLLFNIEKNIVVYQHATTFSNVVWSTPSVMANIIQGLEAVNSPR